MGIYNGNLITVAVKENKPELITSHSSFDVNTLTVDGCGLINFIKEVASKEDPLLCGGLPCFMCPFAYQDHLNSFIDQNNQTIESMKKWLKIE